MIDANTQFLKYYELQNEENQMAQIENDNLLDMDAENYLQKIDAPALINLFSHIDTDLLFQNKLDKLAVRVNEYAKRMTPANATLLGFALAEYLHSNARRKVGE